MGPHCMCLSLSLWISWSLASQRRCVAIKRLYRTHVLHVNNAELKHVSACVRSAGWHCWRSSWRTTKRPQPPSSILPLQPHIFCLPTAKLQNPGYCSSSTSFFPPHNKSKASALFIIITRWHMLQPESVSSFQSGWIINGDGNLANESYISNPLLWDISSSGDCK